MKTPLLIIILLLTIQIFIQADIRYVSKTGSSTPPYMSWATASDSIQKCLNICDTGDTVYVGNGVYHESLIVNKEITLIGMSMDSTVIDGRELSRVAIDINKLVKSNIANFKIYGRDLDSATAVETLNELYIKSCRILNANIGIASRGGEINNVIITKCLWGILGGICLSDSCSFRIQNSIVIAQKNNGNSAGIMTMYGGYYKVYNNIIICDNCQASLDGIQAYTPYYIDIRNNLVSGFVRGLDCYARDTSFVLNNVIEYNLTGILTTSKFIIRNCILRNNFRAIGSGSYETTYLDYNLMWNNYLIDYDRLIYGPNNLYSDPMTVTDTRPDSTLSYDYHLQKYSPAIDKGDPSIKDKDNTRSDLGLYGGEFGESYTYQDLAPRAPRNVTASVNGAMAELRWYKNTEADTGYYNIYRDTVPNFTIDTTKLISRQKDTLFTEALPMNTITLYYKLTAEDKQGNVSEPSEEKVITYTSAEEKYEAVESYQLFQNYPNPFNPSTTISYRLKERGYVKLMVYDIKGELVRVLVNKEQESGYYEEPFDGKRLASGIYLYRIEVIGMGSIPVYSDMKKTILLK